MNLREISRLPASPVAPDLLDAAETLGGALLTLVEGFPDFACLTLLDRHRSQTQLSLAEFWSRARDVQACLLRRGLRAGSVVVMALPTGIELVSAYFGTILAGGIPALLATPSNRVADLRVYSERVGAILSIAGADFLYCEDTVAGLFRGEEEKQLGPARILRPAEVPACTTPPEIASPGAEDIATIQYSSGSTGSPKGVLLTHRAILNNIRATRDHLGLTPGTASVNWIPLYHDMGLVDAFLLPLLCGSPAVLIPTMDFMRDPSLWLWAIHHYRGAMSWSPNFGYAVCSRRLGEHEIEGLDLSSWRHAISAAEPVLADTIEAFSSRFRKYGFAPEAMTPAYGLAESVTIATSHAAGEAPRVEVIDRERLAREHRAVPTEAAGLACVAVGRPLPNSRVEIRDEAGATLEDRNVGDIWLSTDFLFNGYKDAPEQTAGALVDGWLNTGDRGYLVDGELFFLYRNKDLIVIAGDKYAPHDVEAAINRVPGVREGCAVAFGLIDKERGTEELAAVVETRQEGTEALEGLARAIRAEVMRATGLGIRHLKLVAPGSVEKTTSGKLARAATRRSHFGERGDGRL